MDASYLDQIARLFSAHGSRRGLLAVLLIVLGRLGITNSQDASGAGLGPSDASLVDQAQRSSGHRRHQRRRQRRRKHDRHGKPGSIFRGISLWLTNPATAQSTAHIFCGEVDNSGVCSLLAVFDITPGQTREFDTSAHYVYCFIDRRYYFEFMNEPIVPPYIDAAYGGDDSPFSCMNGRTVVVKQQFMSEHEDTTVTLDGHTFLVHRYADKPDFKFFNLQMADTI